MTLPIAESNPEVAQTGVCQSDWLKEYTQNTVFTQDSFETLVKRLSACKRFVFDLETDSLDYMTANCWLGIFGGQRQLLCSCCHDYLDAPVQ
ncbi:DNA polymerase I (EC [uncultured Gammaproteobacteria bacterium]|nr:DNA polymerase I (EC [uncultured Gammaproteobacteria bacterium]